MTNKHKNPINALQMALEKYRTVRGFDKCDLIDEMVDILLDCAPEKVRDEYKRIKKEIGNGYYT